MRGQNPTGVPEEETNPENNVAASNDMAMYNQSTIRTKPSAAMKEHIDAMFNGEELMEFVELATYVAVNDYEGEMLSQRTGLSLKQISERVEALIVTKGSQGAEIHTKGQQIDIPVVPVTKAIDPTGCGDAFRGGLLYGLEQGFDWATTGRLASLMGSIKIASQGPQNHQPSREAIQSQFKKAFNYSF